MIFEVLCFCDVNINSKTIGANSAMKMSKLLSSISK